MIDSSYGEDRIRNVHESCRPRAFRASLRDTEARRGSPQGCCKESEPARSKDEAETRPRWKRPTLKIFRCCRFSLLTSDLSVSQSLSNYLRHRKAETFAIVH